MSTHPVVTAENYQANLAQLWALAFLVEEAPLHEMLAAAEHADSIGALVDPTLYQEKMLALGEESTCCALGHVKDVPANIRRRRAGRGGAAGDD